MHKKRRKKGDIPKLNRRTLMGIAELHVTSDMVRILKELIDLLSEPIALILNKTFENGELPHDWKPANISPIFKKGSRSLAENYRPPDICCV